VVPNAASHADGISDIWSSISLQLQLLTRAARFASERVDMLVVPNSLASDAARGQARTVRGRGLVGQDGYVGAPIAWRLADIGTGIP